MNIFENSHRLRNASLEPLHRRLWRGLLAATSLIILAAEPKAALIESATPEFRDVATAVSQASDGDSVIIPPGTATWTEPLEIKKAITLRGAGIGQTIIIEQLSKDKPLIHLETFAGKQYRVSGIEFRNGNRTTQFKSGIINLAGSSRSVRVDNCKFYLVENLAVRVTSYVRGVIDHNEFIANRKIQFIYLWHQSWAGGTLGDKSWSEPIDWGGPEAMYIESNKFIGIGNLGSSATDTYAGARFVFRYNELQNVAIQSHGTGDGAGRNRGLRQWEIYNNVWNTSPKKPDVAIYLRGGTGVCFGNVVNGHGKFITLRTYRLYAAGKGKFGRADGTSLWDVNDPKGVYYSGVAGAGSENYKLVVPNANWTVDQWKGYTVRVPSSSLHPEGFFHSVILRNTKDTIFVKDGTQVIEKPFVPGEYFEIRRVLLVFDGIGAGTTDMLNDKSEEPAPVFLNQQSDPVHIWDNVLDGKSDPEILPDAAFVEGVHYKKTPRPGYTPYIYPHPLTSEDRPEAPTNVRIVAGVN